VHLEDPGGQAGPRRIVAHDPLTEGVDRVILDEIDRAATEAGAGQPPTDHAGGRAGDVDQCVQLRAAHRVVVAERCMARGEQLAHRLKVIRLEGIGRLEDERVLPEHMPGTTVRDFVKLWLDILKKLVGHVTERGHERSRPLDRRDGRLTLRASLVIGGVRELPR